MLFALQQSGGSAGGGLTILLFQVGAIALVFYFLILRPQGQARKKHAEVLASLKRNDDVMTAGGIVGKVKDIKEVDTNGVKETRVTVESGTSTVIVERSRIIRLVKLAEIAIMLPPATPNTAWAQPGGNAAKSMGHVSLGDSIRPVWSAPFI